MVHRPHFFFFTLILFLTSFSFSFASDQNQIEKRDPKKLEAARMFENQFVRQMIREMRKTAPGDGLIEESMASKIFKEQLDDQYADKWVDSGGIGLINVIYEQLEQKYGNKQKVLTPDLISANEKKLFLLKKTNQGLQIKSRNPLQTNVSLQSPMAGTVLHATNLGAGKKLIIIEHQRQDQSPESAEQKTSLQSRFVHTGRNVVIPGDKITAGQTIAVLPATKQTEERAHVVFGLRKAPAVE